MRVLTLGLASVALSAAATTSSQPTFYKDVLPVLQRNCQNCHRPGEAAPMSFLTYESTRPWAKAIKAAVATKKMPPWFADPNHGKFSNDRTLSESDLNTLVAWVDNGAKEGNPKEGPKPIAFTDGWVIGKPDVVFEVPTAFEIPASGTIDYQYVRMPTGFTEDRYIQFAEARPSDREHCHHIIAFIREPDSPWFKDSPVGVAFVPEKKKDGGGGSGDFLAGYAPGTIPPMLKPGQVKLVKAGSDIVFQLHYTADGKPGSDKSRVGVVFSKDAPKERVVTLAAVNPKFTIPPGDGNYRVDAKITLQEDSTLIQMLPHMHLRGKSFEFRMVNPDGTTEVLLSVPHYSFSWQLSYYLDKPRFLPKGTTIECTAYYDNSANNPYNPDPTKEIHYGEQSWDEMMFGFFDVAVGLDKNPMDLMRPKKEGKKETGAGANE
jgi:hypothetical protein